MQERPFPSHIQDESKEIFTLTEKEKEKYEKHKKEILNLMYTVDEFLNNNTLETGLKNTCCSLMESYVRNFNKSLKYTGELEAEREQRFAEIRSLNEENRELRKQLGEKVSLEDVREKFKNIKRIFGSWWDKFGGGHQSNERLEEYGFYCEISGMIFGDHYSEDGMSDKEKAEYLKQQGFTLNDNQIIYCQPNMELLETLLKGRFPSCELFKCNSSNYGDEWVIREITICIKDLNDFEEK